MIGVLKSNESSGRAPSPPDSARPPACYAGGDYRPGAEDRPGGRSHGAAVERGLGLAEVEDFEGGVAVEAFEGGVVEFEAVVGPPDAAGEVFVGGFEEAPPAFVHGGFAAHVGTEEDAAAVAGEEAAGGAGLAADFVVAGGEVKEEVGVTVEGVGEGGEVVALVAEVAEDEGGEGVAGEEAVAGGEEFGVGGDVFLVEVEALEVGGAFLVGAEGTPAGGMVGDVDVGGDFEFGEFAPEGVEAGIVEAEALCAGAGVLFVALEAPAFVGEFADAARAEAVAAFEFAGGALGVGGVIDVFGVEAAPDLEAGGVGAVEVDLAVEVGAGGFGEDDGGLDAGGVHGFDPGVDVGAGFDAAHGGVGVSVDDGEFGFGEAGAGEDEGGFGGVVLDAEGVHGAFFDGDAEFDLGGLGEGGEKEDGAEHGSHALTGGAAGARPGPFGFAG